MPTLSELFSRFDPAQGVRLSDSWRQGRTAYGGIVTALGVASAISLYPGQMPPLRSAQMSFIGPASGQLDFKPQLLREGKSVVNAGVDVIADGQLAARMVLVFGRARASAIAHDFAAPPAVEGPARCRELALAQMPFAPAFIQNFRMRPAGGRCRCPLPPIRNC